MFKFLKNLLGFEEPILEEVDPMKKYLIVGLGNIGDEYAETRHNIGFKILDALADQRALDFKTQKLGEVAIHKLKGRSIVCLKPSTYMNLSGKAVRYWLEKEKIPVQNLLVITDDINLPYGTLRVKTKGSHGGHNGLKDIQHVLQTTQYNRFRFGVGADFGKGRQVEYVLGTWNEEENSKLKGRLEKSVEIIESFVLSGVARTMNQFNGT
ncbi:aminoacyl-tRNA hydrolase [Maribacter sp. PR1]|uniref:Peptidyl-tRNA hydrolase n=1 Tax=Maribacter cobaltidurans TaxID=1178778 RepID=A0ABU7IQL6_9FLAO|nr:MULTISPECIES: aminoacyl-tRNA hydrolase [Maribacter]MDC6387570.1 aminoacyl-tRNA hydrolase [Maribacter sp. PR1]MEE1974958.1 aminoacyl-tRNA hydrolase [Maribacter cobaltidurans]